MARLSDALRAMQPEQRLAVGAALGLFISMFLPWYSQTNTVVVGDAARATQTSLSAFDAFSFVEAAVLLVSAGVLVMEFARAEQSTFELPGGDGTIIMLAGGWTALLIFYRLLAKPGLHGTQRITSTVGVQWGIFVALLLALGLLYAGRRMRLSERPKPPLTRARRGEHRQPARSESSSPSEPPADADTVRLAPAPEGPQPSSPAAAQTPAGRRPRYPPAPSGQMSFEDAPAPPEDPHVPD
jgi:hypothetical protein